LLDRNNNALNVPEHRDIRYAQHPQSVAVHPRVANRIVSRV
jgi:hypothetical protein